MSASPVTRPRGFVAANLGKVVAAFVAGFVLFAAGFIYVIKARQSQIEAPVRHSVQTTSEPAGGNPVPKAEVTKETTPAPSLPSPSPSDIAGNTDTGRTTPPLNVPGKSKRKSRRNTQAQSRDSAPPPQVGRMTAEARLPESNATPPPAEPAPAPPPPPALLTIPVGTAMQVRISDALSSKRNEANQIFHGSLAAPLEVNGVTLAPAGSSVTGRIVGARHSGLFGRDSVLSLELTQINGAGGKTLHVKTTQWYRNGERRRFPTPRAGEVLLPPGSQVNFRLLQPLTASRN